MYRTSFRELHKIISLKVWARLATSTEMVEFNIRWISIFKLSLRYRWIQESGGKAWGCHFPSLEGHWDDKYPLFMTSKTMNNYCSMDNNIQFHRNFNCRTCPFLIELCFIVLNELFPSQKPFEWTRFFYFFLIIFFFVTR